MEPPQSTTQVFLVNTCASSLQPIWESRLQRAAMTCCYIGFPTERLNGIRRISSLSRWSLSRFLEIWKSASPEPLRSSIQTLLIGGVAE